MTDKSPLTIPDGTALTLGLMLGLTLLGMTSVGLGQKLQGPLGFLITTGVAAIELWVGLYLWRSRYRNQVDLLSVRGWPLALVAYAIVVLLEIVLMKPSLGAFSLAGAAFWLIWYVAFTGVVEELWWRGIWFAIWRGRPIMCIVTGAILFGAMHAVQNSLGRVLVVVGIGLLLGAARYKGVSVGALALVHGICFNWLGSKIINWEERAIPALAGNSGFVLYFFLCAAGAWLIYRLPLKTLARETVT